jgi:hypothetical protein
MLGRVSRLLDQALDEGIPADEVIDLGRREIVSELVAAVGSTKPSLGPATLNLALNFVPYGGVVSTAKDAAEAVKWHRSWVSLLGKTS